MSAATILTFVYGALAVIGGIIGYQQAGSKPSLIAGAVTGTLLILSGVGLVQAQTWGRLLAIAVSALLVVVFISRLVQTQKFMPAGLMIIVGIATLAALLTTRG